MKVIFICERCGIRETEIPESQGDVQLCRHCFEGYEIMKERHKQEISNFLEGSRKVRLHGTTG